MFFKKKQVQPEAPCQSLPDTDTPLSRLRTKIDDARLPPPVLETVARELEKLEKTEPSVAEYAVGFNYIELVVSLPWNISSTHKLDLARAQAVLEARHCGLSQVKQRILEFLAAKTLCSRAQKSILVVDDEEIARSNMEHVLLKDGFSCHSAANGIEALQILAAEEIDLVITDLKMDRMDGLQLLQQINRLAPEIPVIMVTGFATVSSAVEALKKGAAHYLGKPVNLLELRKTVKEVLDKRLFVEMGKGPILCFTGPPGTGKTSVGMAIAEALQRQFVRISLAGLRDEAELRGHRRTYVGALPGRIITELKRVGVNNPVFMLDELDKIGQDFRGDPASALLEILDPEQNVRFTDHYLDTPFDLSRIMFIATANDTSKLPGPLLDRMERIQFAGYTEKEKLQIARQFILPRQMRAAGLPKASLDFSTEAISRVISDYTRESGLRNLEREFADICRKIALLCLESAKQEKATTMHIDAESISRLLGPRKFFREAADGEPQVGIATGLVWAESGGEIINVETVAMRGSGKLILTGSLGDVLQESAQAVLSYIRSRTSEFSILDTFFQDSDIHIHFPSGAISKDGPSAGTTIFAALLSLLTKRPARRDVALSGEMTLSGRILPVSGIREKLLAAKRAGVRCVLLPLANKEEVEALSADVTEGLEVVLVSHAGEVVNRVLTTRAYLLSPA
jgi:ATP-dependent Lon protease